LTTAIADKENMARCWWFGVNNKNSGFVTYTQIERNLLAGGIFAWPRGGSGFPFRYYDEMSIEDKFILWMGDDPKPISQDWGILGLGRIAGISRGAGSGKFLSAELVMTHILGGKNRITPYPSGHPSLTEEVEFLQDVFHPHLPVDIKRPSDFPPLDKYSVIGRGKNYPVTLWEVQETQFGRVLNWIHENSEWHNV
jgi:hypothetical protein